MGLLDIFKSKNGKNANKELQRAIEEAVRGEVKFGFDSSDEIFNNIIESFEEEDVDKKWLKEVIEKEYNNHIAESKSWSHPTDFEKLAKAFDELNKEGIIALHKAGYTKQDGYDDVKEVVEILKEKGISPTGFCFYHTQDLERVIDPNDKNLFLAFDDISQNDIRAIGIGNKIIRILNENGLQTKWDGTIEQRIMIENISWQKTPDNQDWGLEGAINNHIVKN